MKKSIHFLIILIAIAGTINNSTHCLISRTRKLQANEKKAIQLTKNIQTKMESAKNASTPAEKQQIQYELKNDIEEATTYFDSVQNFFGYGPIAEKRREQAEKQKAALEQKLFLEKKRFKTLLTDADKEKSLKIQNKLANQIHTEKITLGQAWSLKQKALAAALTGATAYIGYQYGGQAVSAAKKWFGEKPQTTNNINPLTTQDYEDFISSGNEELPKGTLKKFMKAGAVEVPREPLTTENLNDINLEDYIGVSKWYNQTPQPKTAITPDAIESIDSQAITSTTPEITSAVTPQSDDIGYYESFINSTPESPETWKQWLQNQTNYWYNQFPTPGSMK